VNCPLNITEIIPDDNEEFTSDIRRIVMSFRNQISTLGAIIALLFIIQGCSKSPTDSPEGGGVDQSSIFVSLLNVAVIPDGSETIEITALDINGSPDTFTASSDNEAVATVTQVGSEITVTGVDFGEATITLTTSGGLTRDIPVQVYNHYVLDTGELLITFVDQFTFIWNDQGSGGANDGAFYYPNPPEGYHVLGSLGIPGYSNPNGNYAMMVVKAKDGSDALAEPIGYQPIWEFLLIGGNGPVTVWQPIPPDGYRAMGAVVTAGFQVLPALSDYMCVRDDLTTFGSAGSFIWNDDDTGAPTDLGCWTIHPPESGPHDNAYLETGTFVAWNSWNPPTFNEVMNVLNVELPMLSEAPSQTYIPRLDSYEPPPEETVPLLGKALLSPCTIVNDLLYVNNVQWRVANSPFYRLERQVFYKLLYHNYNQTSEIQTNEVTIISGVTTEESQSYWEETSVSVTAEGGVSIGFFEGKVSTTVSTSFGYSTQTSISELQQTEISSSINTAPGKAAALWQRYNRFVLKRHNGTDLEPVAVWEFGIDSYLTDEYPDN
jgi:hypothetical protein